MASGASNVRTTVPSPTPGKRRSFSTRCSSQRIRTYVRITFGRLGQLAANHVAEDVHDLISRASCGLRGAVDLLESMVQLGVVQRDDRLGQGGGISRLEGGVPLPVPVAEADDDDVGGADQGLCA